MELEVADVCELKSSKNLLAEGQEQKPQKQHLVEVLTHSRYVCAYCELSAHYFGPGADVAEEVLGVAPHLAQFWDDGLYAWVRENLFRMVSGFETRA